MNPAVIGLGLVGGYLVLRRGGGRDQPADLTTVGRADQVPANGVPPRPGTGGLASTLNTLGNSLSGVNRNLGGGLRDVVPGAAGNALETAFEVGAKLDAAVAAGICTYYTGGAGAPVCAAAGKFVSDVNEIQRKLTIKAGTYVVGKAAPLVKAGAGELYSQSKASITNPISSAIHHTEMASAYTQKGIGAVDRGIETMWGASPTAVKIAVAPIYAGTKVATKVAGTAAKVGTQIASTGVAAAKTLESGVKSAVNAVGSGVSTVLGWF